MSTITLDAKLEQRLRALDRANATRSRGAEVKRELTARTITLAQALDDPRAQAVPVFDVLRSQPRWGKTRARRALGTMNPPLSGHRPVGELTARQKTVLLCSTGL